MKISKRQLIELISQIIKEQFTIPKHSMHSGFEYYSSGAPQDSLIRELDGESEEDLDEIYASQGFDGDDIRAGEGGVDSYITTEADE